MTGSGHRVVPVLLPGPDGTRLFFKPLLSCLPGWIAPMVIAYPSDEFLSYERLLERIPASIGPHDRVAILGEHFSGPLAVRLAAMKGEGASVLIPVTTFVSTPAVWPLKLLRFVVHPALLRLAPMLGLRANRDRIIRSRAWSYMNRR